MAQGVNEQVRPLAAIETEGDFLKVRGQVLRADLVQRSDDATLEKRERAFD